MVKFYLLILAVCLLTSCHGQVNDSLTVVNIKGKSVDKGVSDYCANFTLSKKQAQKYFLTATPVSIEVINNNYDVLPCFVYGSGTLNNEQCQWEIRAGGTGTITCTSHSRLTACKDCLP